ncbi:MAG: hypothetical protein JNK82_41205 [Myxococcaceae bacterium]|nr:hypothetical protein [Myxococcaceae bacterium]
MGSDILAVLKALHVPENSLGKVLAEKLKQVQPTKWYPIGMLLESFEALDAKLGTYALRSVGWQIFKLSHAENIGKVASSARDFVYGIDSMYHHANRGQNIGGWVVTRFDPGLAELEKTTPHHCVVEEGILQEALRTIGVKAEIEQTQCLRRGDLVCHFRITSQVVGERWSGKNSG